MIVLMFVVASEMVLMIDTEFVLIPALIYFVFGMQCIVKKSTTFGLFIYAFVTYHMHQVGVLNVNLLWFFRKFLSFRIKQIQQACILKVLDVIHYGGARGFNFYA